MKISEDLRQDLIMVLHTALVRFHDDLPLTQQIADILKQLDKEENETI